MKWLRPKSRGRVMSASYDPFAAPKMINGYLSDEKDVMMLVEELN